MGDSSIAERLRMTHLQGDLEETKKSIEAAVRTPTEDAPDDRDSETWTFPFEYKDRRGKVWNGTFTNAILLVEEHQFVSVLRARWQGGQPLESLDPTVRSLNMALAHMAFSLKKMPEWAKDMTKLRDPDVVMSVWEKVRSHEDRYFRRSEDS